jgi:hypothetical protein
MAQIILTATAIAAALRSRSVAIFELTSSSPCLQFAQQFQHVPRHAKPREVRRIEPRFRNFSRRRRPESD